MFSVLDDCDWGEVFGCSGEVDKNNLLLPNKCIASEDVSTGAVIRKDVKAIYWMSEGEYDGDNWLIGGETKDGRFFFITAGCDYTGWDCQSSGYCFVSRSIPVLVRFGMDDSARRRFNILLEDVSGS